MDKYCVEDLNHLDDTSVNLFDPKDPTIKNENFIYSKTEDLHCNIEENDVLVSKNTHDVIENLTACKSADEDEFIPEDCVSDETVVEKIEITEHTLELGTIQELEHIFREYKGNVADEGTETSQISKIHNLDKTNGKKARKKTRGQKGKLQTNTLDTFLHKAGGRVKKRKVSDGLFVRLERIDISDKLLCNTENGTSSTTSSARTNNENHLGTDSEISSKICELDKTDGKKARKKTRDKKGTVQTSTLDKILHKARGGVKNKEIDVFDTLFVRLKRIDISDKILANSEQRTSSTTSSGRTNQENNLGTYQETPKGLKLNKLPKQVGNSHQLNIKKPKYTINETDSLKIKGNLKIWLNKDKFLVESTLETSKGSIPRGRPKKMSRDIKTIKNKGTSGRNRNRTPKTGVKDMEQQEIDMEEYKCHDCNKVLINRKSLRQHIRWCHEESTQTFQCYHCSRIVKHKSSLILHLRQWHTKGDKLFHCESCLYKTNLQHALVLHVYRVHIPNDQKSTFKCKLCPHEATLKGNLQAHVNRAHKTKKCDQCDWEGHSAHFSMHVQTKHLGEEFICDKCNYKSNRKKNLIAHQLVHSKVKKFSCPKCTYQTHHNRRLKLHLKCHEDTFQICPECSQFVQEGNFYQHMWVHRRNKLRVKKKCPECGKEVFGLSKHLLTHTGDRIQCPKCSYSAIHGASVKQHIQKYHDHHKEQESVICYHCNKEIVNKYSLMNHLRAVHTDDPCECHICGIKLKSKLYISKHVKKAHNNVKWLECDLCPEETRFRTKYARSLKWHRVRHLNKDEIIRYKCEYCPYEARMPDNLRIHVRKYHLKKLKGRRTHSI